MELLQLKYFCLVAKYENMSRAAKELHIVQPAISQSIKRLEKEMGVDLFTRDGRKLSLNEAGSYLYQRVPEIIESLESLPKELRQLVHEEEKKISILVKASSSMIPELIASYRLDHEHVRFSILNSETDQWDLCITSQSGVEVIDKDDRILLEEEIMMVTDNESYQETNVIDLRELANEELIGLREGCIFRNMTDQFMSELNMNPTYSHESDSPAMVREIINALGGFAFYPLKTWGLINNANIRTLHIKNGVFTRRIVLKQNSMVDNSTLHDFINYMVEYYMKL